MSSMRPVPQGLQLDLFLLMWRAGLPCYQYSAQRAFNIVFPLCRMEGRTSLVALLAKNPPAVRETWVRSLGREDPLEKGMATHSSIPAWRIPPTEEPGELQSMGPQRIAQDRAIQHSTGWMASRFPVFCLGSEVWLCIYDVKSSQSME